MCTKSHEPLGPADQVDWTDRIGFSCHFTVSERKSTSGTKWYQSGTKWYQLVYKAFKSHFTVSERKSTSGTKWYQTTKITYRMCPPISGLAVESHFRFNYPRLFEGVSQNVLYNVFIITYFIIISFAYFVRIIHRLFI